MPVRVKVDTDNSWTGSIPSGIIANKNRLTCYLYIFTIFHLPHNPIVVLFLFNIFVTVLYFQSILNMVQKYDMTYTNKIKIVLNISKNTTQKF